MGTELSCDLVEEILLRIPAKSLARLRYTCKQWKTLIEDPKFVTQHLSQKHCREQQFTVFYRFSVSTLSCVGIDFNELDNPSLNLQVSKPLDLRVFNMAHCDGLLLYIMSTKLLVLNPLLNQARWVNYGDGSDLLGRMGVQDAYGLGYISDQSLSPVYKMVRFRCDRKTLKFSCRERVRVDVYEFESDSWKVVVDEAFDGFHGVPKSSVCLKGTPYWLGWYPDDGRLLIQSFDFSKERFEPLSLPPSVFWLDGLSLGNFGGDHLSLLRKQQHGYTVEIYIWEIKQQWSKLMVITTPELVMRGISPHYLIKSNGKLVCYGYHSKTGPLSIYIVGENQQCKKVTHNFNTVGENQQCPKVTDNFFMDHMSGGCYYVPSLRQVPGSLGRYEKEYDFIIIGLYKFIPLCIPSYNYMVQPSIITLHNKII